MFWPSIDAGQPPADAPQSIGGQAALLPADFQQSQYVDVAAADTPQGLRVLVVSSDGRLVALDAARTVKLFVPLKSPTAFAVSIAGDSALVGCADSTVRVFDLLSLHCRGSLPVPPALGQHNVTSPAAAATAAAAGADGVTRPAAIAAVLSPDASRAVVVYGDRSLFVWAIGGLAQGKVVKQRAFFNHASTVWDVAFLPDPRSAADAEDTGGGVGPLPSDTFVTVGADCTARFWNLDSRAVDKQTPVPPGAPERAVSARNVYCSSMLHALYCNEAEDESGSGQVFSVGGTPSRPLDKASWTGQSIVTGAFDPEKGPIIPPSAGLKSIAAVAYPGSVPGAFSLDVAVGDRQGNVRVFDAWSMRQVAYIPAHDGEVLSLAYAQATGAVLTSAGQDGLLHVFDVANAYAHAGTVDRHTKPVTSLAFTQDDAKLISAGGDGTIVFNKLRVEGASPVGLQMARQLAQSGVALPQGMTWHDLSPTDATGTPRSGEVDVSGGRIELTHSRTVPAEHGAILGVAVDATNKNLATVGQDKRLHVHSLRNGRLLRSYAEARGAKLLNRVAMDPSGLFVATAGGDNCVRVHDFFSGECLACLAAHSSKVTGMAWSADCRRLVTTGMDGCIMVWRLAPHLAQQASLRSFDVAAARTKALTERAISLTEMHAGLNKRASAAVPEAQGTDAPKFLAVKPPRVPAGGPPTPQATTSPTAADTSATGADDTCSSDGEGGGRGVAPTTPGRQSVLPAWARSVNVSASRDGTSLLAAADSMVGGRWAVPGDQGSFDVFGAAAGDLPASHSAAPTPSGDGEDGVALHATAGPGAMEQPSQPAPTDEEPQPALGMAPPPTPPASGAATPASAEDEEDWAAADARLVATPAKRPGSVSATPAAPTPGVRASLTHTFSGKPKAPLPTHSSPESGEASPPTRDGPAPDLATQQAAAAAAVSRMRAQLSKLDLLSSQRHAGGLGVVAPPPVPSGPAPAEETPVKGKPAVGLAASLKARLAATSHDSVGTAADLSGTEELLHSAAKAAADSRTAAAALRHASSPAAQPATHPDQAQLADSAPLSLSASATAQGGWKLHGASGVAQAQGAAEDELEDSALLPHTASAYLTTISTLTSALDDTVGKLQETSRVVANAGGDTAAADLAAARATHAALTATLRQAMQQLSQALPSDAAAETPSSPDRATTMPRLPSSANSTGSAGVDLDQLADALWSKMQSRLESTLAASLARSSPRADASAQAEE